MAHHYPLYHLCSTNSYPYRYDYHGMLPHHRRELSSRLYTHYDDFYSHYYAYRAAPRKQSRSPEPHVLSSELEL